MKLACQHCGSPMKRKTLSRGNCGGVALALIVLAIGVGLCFTGIGAIIGLPLILCSLFMGGRRSKVWRCTKCGVILDRA